MDTLLYDIAIELQSPYFLQPLTLNLKRGQRIRDAVRLFVTEHQVPFTEISVLSTVYSLIHEKEKEEARRFKPMEEEEIKSAKDTLLMRYKNHTRQYYNGKEEDIFPRAYHTLVHSPIPSIFDSLLQLEHNYNMAMAELLETESRDLASIQARHGREMEMAVDSGKEGGLTQYFARHVEEMEVAQATWASEIEQLQASQRAEYREFVLKLYEAHEAYLNRQTHVNANSQENLEQIGKEIISSAMSKLPSRGSISSGSMSGAEAREEEGGEALASSPTSMAPSINNSVQKMEEPKDPALAKMIKELQEMGFGPAHAECALKMAQRNMEQAVMLLLEQPQKVNEAVAAASTPPPPPPPTPPPPPVPPKSRSGSVSSVGSGRPRSSSRSSNRASISSGKNRTWSPISFLQQQKQAILSSQGGSSVRKLSVLFGRAMENLGMDDEAGGPMLGRYTDNEPQFVESFTVSLGNQVKSMHNLRLLVSDLDTLFAKSTDPTKEMAHRAQTAASLYGNNLSATLVLLTPRDWPKYKSGKSTNRAFFEKCKASTEFHFDNIDKQLEAIESDFPIDGKTSSIKEGDFFVTRHSNLPLNHVVFHLVVEFESLSKSEITSRSPVLTGIRNILRTVARYDIGVLSLPLLLIPEHVDPFADPSASEQALHRRAESLLKCVRGFLMENTRSSRHTGDENRMRTLQFLLPKSANEGQFSGFRQLLTSVYRTT
ncbi:uncharacterized protein VTP21DRAFT_1969 [Calcarisporiella thermophila]|uniref:uncharacterized protein n=1 Tax=Calcarisporiella thermophila TaxID=911321 RepID=UPI00374379B2